MSLKHLAQSSLFCLFLYSPSLYALNLSDVVSLAQKNDASFLIATADYIAVTEKQPQSLSALLPSIDFSLYASDTSGEISSSGVTTNNNFSANGYTLSLTQTLFNKKLFDALDQSEAETSQALASFQAARLEMIIRAATAYFEVLAAKDNLDFAQSEKHAVSQQLEQSTARFNAGLIAITDVKESQAQFDISIALEIAAKNSLENTKEELQILINTPFEKLSVLDKSIRLLTPEPEDMEQWQNNAIDNNLELRATYYAVLAATEAASASQSDHYPTLNLNLIHDNQ